MPLFRPSHLRYAAASASSSPTRQAAKEALKARSATSSSYPVIPTCPQPTCSCSDMPPDLDIDRSVDLNGTMAPYAEHLIIPSGQADWTSKIEDEKDTAPWGEFTANVKQALSQKGDFHDPYHNVVISTSSFTPPEYETDSKTSCALLFPSFKMVDRVPTKSNELPDFIRTFLLPENLHPSYTQLSEEEQAGKRRDISNLKSTYWADKVSPVNTPTILICSHQTRDSRCGILGPLLHAEFTQYINRRATLLSSASTSANKSPKQKKGAAKSKTSVSHPEFASEFIDKKTGQQRINVGMISHIGGHKFAGNVIVYIPPTYPREDLENNNVDATTSTTKSNDHDVEATGTSTRSKESMDPKAQEKMLKNNSDENEETLDFVADALHPLAGMGIWYGRVEPRHVQGIVEQTVSQGKIIRELFRGGVNSDGSSVRLPLY